MQLHDVVTAYGIKIIPSLYRDPLYALQLLSEEHVLLNKKQNFMHGLQYWVINLNFDTNFDAPNGSFHKNIHLLVLYLSKISDIKVS